MVTKKIDTLNWCSMVEAHYLCFPIDIAGRLSIPASYNPLTHSTHPPRASLLVLQECWKQIILIFSNVLFLLHWGRHTPACTVCQGISVVGLVVWRQKQATTSKTWIGNICQTRFLCNNSTYTITLLVLWALCQVHIDAITFSLLVCTSLIHVFHRGVNDVIPWNDPTENIHLNIKARKVSFQLYEIEGC